MVSVFGTLLREVIIYLFVTGDVVCGVVVELECIISRGVSDVLPTTSTNTRIFQINFNIKQSSSNTSDNLRNLSDGMMNNKSLWSVYQNRLFITVLA